MSKKSKKIKNNQVVINSEVGKGSELSDSMLECGVEVGGRRSEFSEMSEFPENFPSQGFLEAEFKEVEIRNG